MRRSRGAKGWNVRKGGRGGRGGRGEGEGVLAPSGKNRFFTGRAFGQNTNSSLVGPSGNPILHSGKGDGA